MYSELYTHARNRTTHILIAIALIVAASSAIFYFTRDSVPTRASKRTLEEHMVVNVSPQQIGVFWKTDEPDEGWILYGTKSNDLDQFVRSERDNAESPTKRAYHYAIMKNLEPNTTYYYQIVSDNELITDEGKPFEARTLATTDNSLALSPVYGKVTQVTGEPAEGAFALLLIGNAYPLLSMSGKTGEWLVPLQYVVNKQTNSYLPVNDETLVTIQLFTDERRSMVRSTVGRSRPIPQAIILGNNYSFISEPDILSVQDSSAAEITNPSNVSIRYPVEAAVIPGTAPLIKGYGVPGKNVEAHINAKPAFTGRTTVNTEGVWDVPVRRTILPGRYTLTIITEDARDSTVEMKRTFTLIKSGEQVLSSHTEATPSGTLTPTTGATATPRPTAASTPTVIVTTATATPTSVVTAGPTATPAPPVSGINMIPYLFTGATMIILGLGVVLLM